MAHNRDILIRTARALGPLCERFVFTGGSIVELLITDEAGPPVRSTEDVDVIELHDFHHVFIKRNDDRAVCHENRLAGAQLGKQIVRTLHDPFLKQCALSRANLLRRLTRHIEGGVIL